MDRHYFYKNWGVKAMSEAIFMYDDTEDTRTRFVGFIGESKRFDLALTSSTRFYGKTLVHDIQNGRSALLDAMT